MERPEMTTVLLPSEVAEFKALSRLIHVKAGSMVFREGDTPEYIYLIETGYIKTYRGSSSGKVFLISICKPNEVFGIASLLAKIPWYVSVEAVGDCCLWRMNGDTFYKLLRARPDLTIRVACILGKRMHDAEETIVNLASMEVDRRLACLLRDLANAASHPDEEQLRIPIKLTHQDMASMIGTCRQTVTATLRKFKDRGMVKMGKRYIEFVNVEKINRYV